MSSSVDQIIGIDLATRPENVGLAQCRREGDRYKVTRILRCSKEMAPGVVVSEWLRDAGNALLALDAPLGWPATMANALNAHTAGASITTTSNELFRRQTDRFVAQRTGKTPLDVGADRIARTAHAALSLLEALRADLKEPIPLAWGPVLSAQVEAIEVYPAATLITRGVSIRGYKQIEAVNERRAMLDRIRGDIDINECDEAAVASDHCLDALICALAAIDFLKGNVHQPTDHETSRKEGWIWFSKADA